jgi:hypothetical protein
MISVSISIRVLNSEIPARQSPSLQAMAGGPEGSVRENLSFIFLFFSLSPFRLPLGISAGGETIPPGCFVDEFLVFYASCGKPLLSW